MRFQVDRAGIKDEAVWLLGQDEEGRPILGAVTREALEDDSEPAQSNLSSDQLILLAAHNEDLLSQVLADKFAAGEAVVPKPGDLPRVFIRTGDLRELGRTLSASVLQSSAGWADPRSGRF
jgi:hypothetical protein